MTNIEQLREIIKYAHAVGDQQIALDIEAAAEAVIEDAEKDAFYIECLHSGGVDNWEWFSESLQEYWKRYED